jgi:hypothetical protein
MTLSDCGSPEATPSGKRSRRSVQLTLEARTKRDLKAREAPQAAANSMNLRLDIVIYLQRRIE